MMITRRIATSLRKQDWTTFAVELVLVIAGVLIALQLDQWNENRKDRAREITFLMAVKEDVRQDIEDINGLIRLLGVVTGFGETALKVLEAGACTERCRSKLVAIFHASQWVDVRPNRAAYDEIRRTGLPRDTSLRKKLTRYYYLSEQYNKIFTELPRYREVVRSEIPAATQDYLWANCYEIVGRQQTLISDCDVPITEEQAASIIYALQTNDESKRSLNFWMSNVSVVNTVLPEQIVGAESVIAALSEYIERGE